MIKPKSSCNICIIGGGLTGLTLARDLAKRSIPVTLFEADHSLGGLTSSFEYQKINLEKFYHHIFSSDKYAIDLIDELKLSDKLIFQKAKNAIFIENVLYPLNTAFDYMKINHLPFFERIFSGIKMVFLKLQKWSDLKTHKVVKYLPDYLGKPAYDLIWKPQLEKKFGPYSKSIMMPWFWSRITSRSSQLGYLSGGFQLLTDALAVDTIKSRGVIKTSEKVISITKKDKNFLVQTDKDKYTFSHVIVAASPQTLLNLAGPMLSQTYQKKYLQTPYLGAVCLVLSLKHSVTDSYWISLNDYSTPFLAAIEHSNLDKIKKPKSKIIYLSIYAETQSKNYHLSKEELLQEADLILKKLNPKFSPKWIKDSYVFKNPNAQHIADQHYYRHLPKIKTPIPNLYHASLSHIYPQDRGINYAIALAHQTSEQILQDLQNKE